MNLRALVSLAVVLQCGLVGTAFGQRKTFTVNADFDQGTLKNAVDTNPNNQLVLGPTPVSQTHLIWATNYLYGYVVRLDTLTGKQTGRYDSVLTAVNGVATGAQAAQTYCDFATTGNCPGRVAVDANGDVWIVNRAFSQQGTLTKFSGNLAHCIDRNNNGVIDTSFDKNNDGLVDVTPTAGEYFGQNDECILTTIKIGGMNALPRGVAIDKYGKVWVATYNEGKLYRFNPDEPVTLEATVTLPAGANPYSLATGGDYVFVSNRGSGGAMRVHVTTLAVQAIAACAGGGYSYGVVADPSGNVAYLGGYGGDGVYFANFTNNTCAKYAAAGGSTTAVTLDLNGNLWVANYANATVHKVSPAGVLLGTYPSGGLNPHGLSVDFQGNLWVVNHSPPNMTKISVNTGAIIGTYTLAGPGIPNADPYLYSDFTGTQINRQAPYTKVGSWDGTYDGGAAGTPWKKIVWNTEPQGAVPALTSLTVGVRAADSLPALGQASFRQAGNGVPLTGLAGRYVQVSVSFTGPGFATPVLSDLTVEGACPVTGEACCVTAADCNDTNGCTLDLCPTPGGSCTHQPVADCCNTSADCDDHDLCTFDVCPASGGQCSHAPLADCCLTNADCNDSKPCTLDVCSGPGGTCSNSPISGCCMTAADCTSGSVCAAASCPTPGGVCQTSPIAGCCAKDVDCKDTNPCTADRCDVATGVCSNTVVAGCCVTDGDCSDGLPCTRDRCPVAGAQCVFTAIAGCCVTNAECDDQNPCTTEVCAGPGGICAVTQVPGCCMTNADCADGNACTTDTCSGPGGTCANAPVAGCCLHNADCDDGDVCTKDSCSFAGGTCSNAAIAGCCKSDADCPGSTCANHWCVPVELPPDGGQPDAETLPVPDDASVVAPADASTEPPADAASMAADASTATPGADAATGSVDAGTGAVADTGCGCGAASGSGQAWASVALLCLVVVGRKRRRGDR
ncbi:MAG TPA: hypothetical protein VGK67_00855 [Myxococcales bacterium]|jgi:streptogramin lyase